MYQEKNQRENSIILVSCTGCKWHFLILLKVNLLIEKFNSVGLRDIVLALFVYSQQTEKDTLNIKFSVLLYL